MSIELTHEQALHCRLLIANPKALRQFANASCVIFNGVTLDHDQATAALAAYDARWKLIETSRLNELLEIEVMYNGLCK